MPLDVAMTPRLQAIGYVELETRRRTILGRPGLRFRGHQFRHSEARAAGGPPEPAFLVRRSRGEAPASAGCIAGSVVASWVHAHWASNPRVAEELVASCAAWRLRRGVRHDPRP